jgi:hypothetical protein
MKIGLTGHQKMPSSAYKFAEKAINNLLKKHTKITGICNLAAGSDQLFAEKIISSGNELFAVIPSKNYERTFDSEGLKKFRKLLQVAKNTEILDFLESTEEAFLAAGKRVVDLSDELVAIWDGQQAQGKGGTEDIVSYAQSIGKKVTVIWPEGVRR